MKATVIGVGGIGGWMAGLLADAGWEVSLLARGATLERIRRDGLCVRRKSGERRYRLPVAGEPKDLERPDTVVITVKGHHVPDIAPAVAELCGPDTMVVSAINGVPWWFFGVKGVPLSGLALPSLDPDDAIARQIPSSRVIGCVVYASSFTPEPGVAVVDGEDRLIVGEPDGTMSSRVETFAKAVTRPPVRGIVSPNVRADIWTKLLGNVSLNPISVLTMATTSAMLDDVDVRELIRTMMLEVQALGTRIGLPVDTSPDERIAMSRVVGSVKTSMLRDVEVGRAIEIGPILGALVDIADAVAVPLPTIRLVLALLRLRAQVISA